jgi:hypothetical protein
MSPLVAFLANAAEEGKDIVTAMLLVGLVFLAVIALGDLYQRGARKRHSRDSRYP